MFSFFSLFKKTSRKRPVASGTPLESFDLHAANQKWAKLGDFSSLPSKDIHQMLYGSPAPSVNVELLRGVEKFLNDNVRDHNLH